MTDSKNKPLLFIFITVCLDAIGLGIIIPVLPDLLKEVLGSGIAQAALWGGILSAGYAVMQFLFGPLVGSLSDQFGRRPVLLIGLGFLCIDYLIMGFAPSIALLVAGRLMAGVAGSTHVTAKAFIADVSPPEKRAANFGMIGAAFGIGFILGPVIGGLLGEWGTRAPFFAAAALALINCIYGFFILPETLTPEQRRPFSLTKSNPLAGILVIRRFPALGWIFLTLFFYDIAHFVYPAIWSYWGHAAFQWSSFEIGMSLAIVGVGHVIVQGLLIRRLMPVFGETKVAVAALLINVISLIFLGFVSSELAVYLSLPFIALGTLVGPALIALLSNAVGDDEQGMLQGVISGVAAISAIISPLVMTNLFYRFSDNEKVIFLPGAPFLLAAVLCGLALLAFSCSLGSKRTQDRARPN